MSWIAGILVGGPHGGVLNITPDLGRNPYRAGRPQMREPPQLSDSPADCLPYWTALAGRAQDQLAWDIYSEGHLVVATLDGELDLSTMPALAERLDPLAAAGCHLILDLSALSFFDCTGLNLFLRWQQQAAAAGSALHLMAPAPRVRRLMALTGTHGLLPAEPRPCRRNCCVDSHLRLRTAGRGPS
jgi:anti-anti-sigma factor